jgi:hypothetical protein
LTPIKTSEVAISFYAKSGAGPSPINGRAIATAGNAATATPFPYMPPWPYSPPPQSVPHGGIGTENSQNRNP